MQGFENPYAEKLRSSAEYMGKGYFSGQLYRIEWYPGAIYDPASSTRVHGEIYCLRSLDVLAELDEYEEVLEDEAASLYVRRVVPVRCGPEVVRDSQGSARNGQQAVIDCWAYLYNKSVGDLPFIEDGYFKIRP